jgi:hypothetical protein
MKIPSDYSDCIKVGETGGIWHARGDEKGIQHFGEET